MKMAVFWVVATIALMMEAVQTSETSVNSYQSTRRYNPEDSHLRTHRRENFKLYLVTDHLEYLSVVGKIILKWTLKNLMQECELLWLGTGSIGALF
jgi:hypothetical protein